MLKKIRKLADLSLREAILLVQFLACALVLEVALRCVSLPDLMTAMAVATRKPYLRHFPFLHSCSDPSCLATFAVWAARAIRGDRACLIRSLLLFWALQARDEQPQLLIGVRKERDDFQSHAWLEAHGQVIWESVPAGARFVPILRV